ncbi:hypothetical protein PIB30_087860 [Stylosanthes scabra]|uniref:Uncharacterized protein n=1 Tax=Stylosanthes scabra TaxID=79078 RepID=A0ABU6YSI2_9FABA|nr:hypothetical protein [Stylosanthes scabra]
MRGIDSMEPYRELAAPGGSLEIDSRWSLKIEKEAKLKESTPQRIRIDSYHMPFIPVQFRIDSYTAKIDSLHLEEFPIEFRNHRVDSRLSRIDSYQLESNSLLHGQL